MRFATRKPVAPGEPCGPRGDSRAINPMSPCFRHQKNSARVARGVLQKWESHPPFFLFNGKRSTLEHSACNHIPIGRWGQSHQKDVDCPAPLSHTSHHLHQQIRAQADVRLRGQSPVTTAKPVGSERRAGAPSGGTEDIWLQKHLPHSVHRRMLRSWRLERNTKRF